MPVAVLKGTGGSAATYYVGADHLNAPHIITNSSGASVWVWDHLAFGDNAPNQNPSGLGVFSYGARFPGQVADGESGLNYNMFRDYAPYQGRYVQSDPIGLAGTVAGSLNTYGYVGGNPVTGTDPHGLQEVQVLIPLVAIPLILGPTLQQIINQTHNQNTSIPTTNQSTSDGSSANTTTSSSASSGGKQCTPDDKQHCEDLLRIDTDTCNAITRRRGSSAGAACHASASERYAACLVSRPLPPLNTWNN